MQNNGIIDPTKFDPVAQAYIKAHLIPAAPTGLFSSILSDVNNADELTTRFDLNLSAKDKLSATVALNRTTFLNPLGFATVPGFPDRTVANYSSQILVTLASSRPIYSTNFISLPTAIIFSRMFRRTIWSRVRRWA